jgi:uncharacterized membrane protein
MEFTHQVVIDAPIERVWAVYADVEHWSEWTASIRSVELLDGASLALGARAKIRQPKLPVATWEVTAFDEGRSWTWVATGPGARTAAEHVMTPQADGATLVETRLTQEGPLGTVIGRVYASLTRRYLAMEAAGLKARCESAA